MPPFDPDDRDLAALRGRLPADPADGLDGPGGPGAQALGDDEAALRRLGAVARSLRDEDFAAESPPPAVWAAISAAVDAPAAGGRDTAPPAVAGPPGGAPEPDAAPERPAAPGHEPAPPPPVPLRRGDSRRERRGVPPRWRLAAAAAVVLVVAAVGAVAVTGRDSGPDVVASAVLDPLVDATGPGQAELVAAGGTKRLDVSLSEAGLPAPDGYYEVWLIDRDVQDMVSLGPVRDDGTYDVPATVDVTRFPIVDVSREPADGNPTHSGTSVLRGKLA